jgi:hypothetical protein
LKLWSDGDSEGEGGDRRPSFFARCVDEEFNPVLAFGIQGRFTPQTFWGGWEHPLKVRSWYSSARTAPMIVGRWSWAVGGRCLYVGGAELGLAIPK